MAIRVNNDAGAGQPILLDNNALTKQVAFELEPEVKLLEFSPEITQEAEEVNSDELISTYQEAKEEYESNDTIKNLLAEFLESIRTFIEGRFTGQSADEIKDKKDFDKIKQQIKDVHDKDKQAHINAQIDETHKKDNGALPKDSSELYNPDGTMKNDFKEIEAKKDKLEDENTTIGKRYGEGYVEVDLDGDGLYDHKAEYDESGKKTQEEIDTNGDGKLDTMVGYDENGKVIWKMADTDFDGSLDLSESYE